MDILTEEDCDNLLAWLAKLEVGITKTCHKNVATCSVSLRSKVVMSVQHAEGLGNRLVTTSWNCFSSLRMMPLIFKTK